MHRAAFDWLRIQANNGLKGLDCVDIGGRNVNGSIKTLFDPRSWVAVDQVDGNGVDIVADAASWYPDREYDLVCCTEVLEHVLVPSYIVSTCVRAAKTGGTILITAAAPDRVPHGATGKVPIPQGEHYRNIPPEELNNYLVLLGCDVTDLTYDKRQGDVYARAVKL